MINISCSKNKIYTKKIKDKTKPLSADMLSIQEMIKLYIVKVLHKGSAERVMGCAFCKLCIIVRHHMLGQLGIKHMMYYFFKLMQNSLFSPSTKTVCAA